MMKVKYIGIPTYLQGKDILKYEVMNFIFKIGETYEVIHENPTDYAIEGFLCKYPKAAFSIVNEYKDKYKLL